MRQTASFDRALWLGLVALAAAGCGPHTAARVEAIAPSFGVSDFDELGFRFLPLDHTAAPLFGDALERSHELADLDDFPGAFPFYFNVIPGESAAAAVVEVDGLRLGQLLASTGVLVTFAEGEVGHFPLVLAPAKDLPGCEAAQSDDSSGNRGARLYRDQNICGIEERDLHLSVDEGERFGVRFLRVSPGRHDNAQVRILCEDQATAAERFSVGPVPIHAGLSLRSTPLSSASTCHVYTSLVAAEAAPIEYDLLYYEDGSTACVEDLPPATSVISLRSSGEPTEIPLTLCPGSSFAAPLEIEGDAAHARAAIVPEDPGSWGLAADVICGDGSSVRGSVGSPVNLVEMLLALPPRPPRGDTHRCFVRASSFDREAIPATLRLSAFDATTCPDDSFEPNDSLAEATGIAIEDEDYPPEAWIGGLALCPMTGASVEDDGPWHDWFTFEIADTITYSSPWCLWFEAEFANPVASDYAIRLYRVESGSPVDETASWTVSSYPSGGLAYIDAYTEDLAFGSYAVRFSCATPGCEPEYNLELWTWNDHCN